MKRLIGALAVLSLVLFVGTRASGVSGSTTDPDDTTSKLDVKTASHSDTSSTISYLLTFQAAWSPSQTPYYTVAWLFDADNDGAFDDGCVVVTDKQGEPGSLEQFVLKGDCDTGNGTFSTLSSGTATQPDGSSLAVSFPRSNLVAMGVPNTTGASYYYKVRTFDSNSAVVKDQAPDTGFVTHTLDDAATTTSSTSTSSTTSTTAVAPTTGAATISPATVAAGGTVTVSGGGFGPGQTLSAVLTSDPVALGTSTSDAAGNFSFTATIPRNTTNGTHTITVTGLGANGATRSVAGTLTVTGGLKVTGSRTGTLLIVGLFVLAYGAVLVAISRPIIRRRLY